MTIQQFLPLLIFTLTIAIIITEKVNRSIVAVAGGVLMLVTGMQFGFYTQEQALKSIDFNTIGLLLGMMILVVMLQQTGFFEYVAILMAKKSKGNTWHLLVILGSVTTVLSMFLDNVTTVILIAPVTVVIAQILGINPLPFLISEAILSNTGGAATLIGDPPNIIIGSMAGFTFMDFIINLMPVVLITWVCTLFFLKYIFRKSFAKKSGRIDALLKMDAGAALKDRKTLTKLIIVLFLTIMLFFFHHLLHFKPSLVAFIGVAIAFLWINPDINKILKEIEWGVLLFFVFLFIGVGGLESSGMLEAVGKWLATLASSNMLLLCIIFIWGSAIMSACVDNIPFTMAMVPIILNIGNSGINTDPLWWALALGVGFGGNGTPIGATANIVVMAIAEKNRTPITFKMWMKVGLPIMILNCLVASLVFIAIFLIKY